ncbi:threonine/serine dehydratase [Legionella sp. km535]|uniref:threonine/serine dehydratase n=1 Tax=Legionella sp. km535 TaxID=2498107 RepID=UPI000F8DAF55|nr:threonine/serine dehydratase [Legionella sp. km535]RUR18245.1 threonine/serine dehydratase [Legionella sp. km535]
MLDFKKEIIAAEHRIRSSIRETPLEHSLSISKLTQTQCYLKCENLQYTGSFKVRGALNTLLSLSPEQKRQGVVTASSGNHGAAVAFGIKKLNIPGLIFVPEHVSPTKADNIRQYDAQLKLYGTDCVQAEFHAIEYATLHQKTYISPYNNAQVIAGQGTLGLELLRQLNQIDVILVPVGGGGLISGIAGFIKAVSPRTKVIGCLPEHSPVMAESIKAGTIIEMNSLPTLSDATAGGIETGAMTFNLCQRYVDDWILVSEQEISNAIITLLQTHHMLVEGASGVALAALIKNAEHFSSQNVVVVLSGANIGLDTLKTILI